MCSSSIDTITNTTSGYLEYGLGWFRGGLGWFGGGLGCFGVVWGVSTDRTAVRVLRLDTNHVAHAQKACRDR